MEVKICKIVFLVVLLLPAASSATKTEFYTVQLGNYKSRTELSGAISALGGINGLWFRKKEGIYGLYNGIFPDRKTAGLLVSALDERGIPSKITKESIPQRGEWVARKAVITLRDIGHENPLLLQGVQAYLSFNFPWDSSIDMQTAVLKLKMRISGSMRPESSITIKAEGIPLVSFSVVQLRKQPDVLLNLSGLQGVDIGDSLDVEISGSFSATDNLCLDMMSKDLWIMVANTSELAIEQRWPPETARQFFSDPVAGFNFTAIPAEQEAAQAVLRISGLVGSTARSIHSRIGFQGYSLQKRNIFIGKFAKDIMVLGSNIFLTPRGADIVASQWMPALVFSRLKGSIDGEGLRETPANITFEDLGMKNRTSRGSSDLVFFTEFSPQELGGWPAKLIFTLVYSHTPVIEQERCFLRVRLNGVLIESHEIRGEGGQHSFCVDIPTRYLHDKNYLEMAFSYFINRGDCVGSYPDFEVSVFKDSFFTVTAYDSTPPLTLDTYPGVFLRKGAVVLSSNAPRYLHPGARLVEIQGFMQQEAPDISLVSLDSLAQKEFDYAVLVLEPGEAKKFSPLVDIAPKFLIKNPLTGKLMIELDTDEPATVLQTFYDRDAGIPMLVCGMKNTGEFPVQSVDKLFMSHPNANVGIIHNDQWYALSVGKKYRVVYPDRHGLHYYWLRFRIIVFIAIGAAALVFFFYIYHVLAKEK